MLRHGIEHWFRVLINGRLIAAQTGADVEVIEHFALLHDVKRYDESRGWFCNVATAPVVVFVTVSATIASVPAALRSVA